MPLAPSAYVQLRREAHGHTRDEIARRLAAARGKDRSIAQGIADARCLLTQIETPGAIARYRATIDLLSLLIGFDPAVYWQLAEEPADRHPRICLACGCSAHDPCTGHRGVCTLEHDTCTRCAVTTAAREAA